MYRWRSGPTHSSAKRKSREFKSHPVFQVFAWLRREVIRLLYMESDAGSSPAPGTRLFPESECGEHAGFVVRRIRFDSVSGNQVLCGCSVQRLARESSKLIVGVRIPLPAPINCVHSIARLLFWVAISETPVRIRVPAPNISAKRYGSVPCLERGGGSSTLPAVTNKCHSVMRMHSGPKNLQVR